MTVITGISDVKKSGVGRIKPQPRRMQERAAENWRLFDSMSIEWLPVEAEFTRCLLNKPIVRILPGIL
ncbi:hypothetical protein FNH47_13150 [Salmonella enterica subsp. houtenae]|uniref:Uncharacterized protein n=1 Tax=Salmonella houtenae TaxID=59205 RepID=A0A5Y2SFS9_SALHO|nr:hypothetical protein [Salmonella enterica subsp. houtenae]